MSTLPAHGRFGKRRELDLAEVLPAAELDRLALEQELDALAFDAAADLREAERVRRRGEQLVVLAEAEVGRPSRPGRAGPARARSRSRQPERRAMWPASRARPSERSISACACAARRRPSSRRSGGREWRCVAKGRAGGAERAGHDEQVAGAGAAAAGNAFRAAERGHGEVEALGGGRVAAEHGHAGLVQALVELEHVLEPRLCRRAERRRSAPPARRPRRRGRSG